MIRDIENAINGIIKSVRELNYRLDEILSNLSAFFSILDKIFASRGVEVLLVFLVFGLFFRFYSAFFDLSRKVKMILSIITVTVIWSHLNYLFFGAYRLNEILVLYFWMFLPFTVIYASIWLSKWLRLRFFYRHLNEEKKTELIYQMDETFLRVKKNIIDGNIKDSEKLLQQMADRLSNIKEKKP